MNRIKFLREEHGWTQIFLAEQAGISRQVLSNYENEVNQPSPDLLIKFADIFECSIDYLLGREDDFGTISIQNEKPVRTLKPDEQELLDIYHALEREHKSQILEYARYFATRSAATKKKA